MKKLILLTAVCFGVFVCQNVVAQSQNLQSTPIVKQAVTPANGGNTTNALALSPTNGSTVTKDAQPVQLQAAQQSGGNSNNAISLTVNQQPIKNGQPVQIVSKTYQVAPIPLGRAVIEQ